MKSSFGHNKDDFQSAIDKRQHHKNPLDLLWASKGQ